ncbi:ABC transporter ATP-binding protein [Paraprevotella clara]|uniref:ABC transporter, ATP-binding protein n=1 Tax=Paraprevotella clara YIT 11840 TaxID=762968 RepID=G5SLK7_9BACT|nr:ABC transporter ATP-binding protein [Paraprevotella clara]EHH01773.1 ABC transporter, ATP-binding protein [Paraprevotella clara YIT 11840]
MIELENIYKVFSTDEIETFALNGVSLNVKKGDFMSIMGASGCGKSTLLNIIGHLDNPTKGTIRIEGTDTGNMTDKELSRLRNEKFGFIFQSFHLIPSLNILQNVELPMLYSRENLSSKEVRERAVSIIEKVGLVSRMKHFPSQLSGGQCQRAAIARAMMAHPHVLLADEPTGNLDSRMGHEIMDLLLELNAEGMTVVMVTHDAKLAAEASVRVMMNDGEITDVINGTKQ